jgi:hypothetical protein
MSDEMFNGFKDPKIEAEATSFKLQSSLPEPQEDIAPTYDNGSSSETSSPEALVAGIETSIEGSFGINFYDEIFAEWWHIWQNITSQLPEGSFEFKDKNGNIEPEDITNFIKLLEQEEILGKLETKAFLDNLDKIIKECRDMATLNREDAQEVLNALVSVNSRIYSHGGKDNLSLAEYLEAYYSFLDDISFQEIISQKGYKQAEAERIEKIYQRLTNPEFVEEDEINTDFVDRNAIARLIITHKGKDYIIIFLASGSGDMHNTRGSDGVTLTSFNRHDPRDRYGFIVLDMKLGIEPGRVDTISEKIQFICHEIDHAVRGVVFPDLNSKGLIAETLAMRASNHFAKSNLKNCVSRIEDQVLRRLGYIYMIPRPMKMAMLPQVFCLELLIKDKPNCFLMDYSRKNTFLDYKRELGTKSKKTRILCLFFLMKSAYSNCPPSTL